MPFISISAPSIVSGMSGESEKTLRDTFEEAKVRVFLALCPRLWILTRIDLEMRSDFFLVSFL